MPMESVSVLSRKIPRVSDSQTRKLSTVLDARGGNRILGNKNGKVTSSPRRATSRHLVGGSHATSTSRNSSGRQDVSLLGKLEEVGGSRVHRQVGPSRNPFSVVRESASSPAIQQRIPVRERGGNTIGKSYYRLCPKRGVSGRDRAGSSPQWGAASPVHGQEDHHNSYVHCSSETKVAANSRRTGKQLSTHLPASAVGDYDVDSRSIRTASVFGRNRHPRCVLQSETPPGRTVEHCAQSISSFLPVQNGDVRPSAYSRSFHKSDQKRISGAVAESRGRCMRLHRRPEHSSSNTVALLPESSVSDLPDSTVGIPHQLEEDDISIHKIRNARVEVGFGREDVSVSCGQIVQNKTTHSDLVETSMDSGRHSRSADWETPTSDGCRSVVGHSPPVVASCVQYDADEIEMAESELAVISSENFKTNQMRLTDSSGTSEGVEWAESSDSGASAYSIRRRNANKRLGCKRLGSRRTTIAASPGDVVSRSPTATDAISDSSRNYAVNSKRNSGRIDSKQRTRRFGTGSRSGAVSPTRSSDSGASCSSPQRQYDGGSVSPQRRSSTSRCVEWVDKTASVIIPSKQRNIRSGSHTRNRECDSRLGFANKSGPIRSSIASGHVPTGVSVLPGISNGRSLRNRSESPSTALLHAGDVGSAGIGDRCVFHAVDVGDALGQSSLENCATGVTESGRGQSTDDVGMLTDMADANLVSDITGSVGGDSTDSPQQRSDFSQPSAEQHGITRSKPNMESRGRLADQWIAKSSSDLSESTQKFIDSALTARTRATYKRQVSDWLDWTEQQGHIDSLHASTSDLLNYLGDRCKERGWRVNTAKSVAGVLRRFILKQEESEGFLRNVNVKKFFAGVKRQTPAAAPRMGFAAEDAWFAMSSQFFAEHCVMPVVSLGFQDAVGLFIFLCRLEAGLRTADMVRIHGDIAVTETHLRVLFFRTKSNNNMMHSSSMDWAIVDVRRRHSCDVASVLARLRVLWELKERTEPDKWIATPDRQDDEPECFCPWLRNECGSRMRVRTARIVQHKVLTICDLHIDKLHDIRGVIATELKMAGAPVEAITAHRWRDIRTFERFYDQSEREVRLNTLDVLDLPAEIACMGSEPQVPPT